MQLRLSFLTIFFCFFFNFSFSQEPVVQVSVLLREQISDTSSVPLDNAVVEVFMDGEFYYSDTSNVAGKFSPFDLPINHTYLIYFKKSGYVSKIAEINTTFAAPEDLMPITFQMMEVTLFKSIEGIDFSLLETTPIIKFSFETEGLLNFDRTYLQEMQVKIANLIR